MYLRLFLSLWMPLVAVSAAAQISKGTSKETAIYALDFLAGNWAGPGISYAADGTTSVYHDTEYVRFDLEGRLLLINARGDVDGETTYALHTVIWYDSEAEHYWYTPYTGQRRPRRLACRLEDQKFLCANEAKTFRLTFQRLEDGRWNEFGERLEDGHWRKTFETRLSLVE